MTQSQERILRTLGSRSMTVIAISSAVDGKVRVVQRTLDALYKKSWVTITPMGRYCATERGRKKIAP